MVSKKASKLFKQAIAVAKRTVTARVAGQAAAVEGVAKGAAKGVAARTEALKQ